MRFHLSVIACLLAACLLLLVPSMATAARDVPASAAAAASGQPSSSSSAAAAAANVKPSSTPVAPVLPAGVTEVAVDFTNSAGERLVGLLSTSSVASAPRRVAIIVTGMLYNKKSIFYPTLANRLLTSAPGSDLSVSTVLRFDWSGMGGSEGAFQYGGYKKLVSDLESAVKYVHEKLSLPVHAIIGHSMGSDVVLLYGSKYPHLSNPFHVPNVVAISPRYDMTKGEEGRFSPEALAQLNTLGYAPWVVSAKLTVNVTKATLDEKVHTDLSVVRQLRDGPNTLIVFGDADTTIPPADGKTIAAIILSGKSTGTHSPPASLVVPAVTPGGVALRPDDVKAVGSTLRHALYLLPGADHAYTTPSTASEQLAQTVNAWLLGVNNSKRAVRRANRPAAAAAAPAVKKAASAASKLQSLKKKVTK